MTFEDEVAAWVDLLRSQDVEALRAQGLREDREDLSE